MATFFAAQLDYIFFFYGLAFLLMAGVCFVMRKPDGRSLPWLWLGLFGVSHGLNEWLDLLALSIADNQLFLLARTILMALSFIFLAEFGRRGAAFDKEPEEGGHGMRLLMPLAVIAALGLFSGVKGLSATVRYSFGLAGGLWAAFAFFRGSRRLPGGGWLLSAGVTMVLYAFAAGTVVPELPFFPASVINYDTFFSMFGFPIQLLRGLLAVWISVSVMRYYRLHVQSGSRVSGFAVSPAYTFRPLTIVLAIVVSGWFLTNFAGKHALADVSFHRFVFIIITLILSMLALVFFVAWYRSREAAAQGLALQLASQRLADEEKLRNITSALGEGVLVQDLDGRLTFMNPEAERLLGYKEAELLGVSVREAVECRDKDLKPIPADICGISEPLRTGKPCRIDDENFTKKDGSTFPVSYVSSPVYNEGRISGAVMAFQDISERKKLERQSADFYAMITHDLKSPLSVILGYTDLMTTSESAQLNADALSMVEGIEQSCRKLFEMVDEFLTISRLEVGHISFNGALEDVGKLLEALSVDYALMALKGDITFKEDIPEGLPKTAIDKPLLQRAVNNLVYNAFNYTQKGGTVTLKAESVSEGGEFIVISVKDTGPGISAEDSERIFEKYYRSPRTSGIKGIGLGLAIVKAVAETHGGRVELVSSVGQGSTFKIILPIIKD